MRYLKPNLDYEWREALRYREFEKMGKKGWMDIASNNYTIISYSKIKNVLGNVDLDYDSLNPEKKKRFEEALRKGEIEIPMAVKFNNHDYDLLGGNTRLAGLIRLNIDPKIYVVDLTEPEGEGEFLEKHNPYDENDDKDDIFPTGSSDWNKKKKNIETKEMMGAASAGAFSGPLSGPKEEPKEQEFTEATTASSSGQYDVPAFGKTSRGGRRDPLKIDGPSSIYKGRAVTDKNFPKWGGPKSVFVKVKDKCKKYPYCNQGDINAIQVVKEDKELQQAIMETSKKHGISYSEMENIVLNEINKIFI